MLALFGIRNFSGQCFQADVGQFVADDVPGGAQCAGVDHQNLFNRRAEQFGQVPQQSVANQYWVRFGGSVSRDLQSGRC